MWARVRLARVPAAARRRAQAAAAQLVTAEEEPRISPAAQPT